jgi:hypothetical protein
MDVDLSPKCGRSTAKFRLVTRFFLLRRAGGRRFFAKVRPDILRATVYSIRKDHSSSSSLLLPTTSRTASFTSVPRLSSFSSKYNRSNSVGSRTVRIGKGRGRGLGWIIVQSNIVWRKRRRRVGPHRRLRISTFSSTKSTSRRGDVGWVVSQGSTWRILSPSSVSVSAKTTLPCRTTRRRDDQLAATEVQVSDQTRARLSKEDWVA